MSIIGIIPARMASSRFPGKPMAKIQGIPMLGHCYFRSKMSTLLEEVYVATCDQEIVDYVESIGGKAIMTSPDHERASDRTAEALSKVEDDYDKVDIVVMIQGDEPMLQPGMIDEAVAPMVKDESILVTNLMARIRSHNEFNDSNEIKVVVNKDNSALYFSRAPIPYLKGKRDIDFETDHRFKQVCIIPFRYDFLNKFNELEPTSLEVSESVDMMRVLEHGYKVNMVPTAFDIYSVDTEADRQRVEKLLENDELIKKYK